MKKTEIQKRLVPLIKTSIHSDDKDTLSDNAVLFGQDGVFDSVAVLKLIISIEEAFSITIDEQDIAPANFKTLAALTRYIESKVA
jgi:acyl carrier protein